MPAHVEAADAFELIGEPLFASVAEHVIKRHDESPALEVVVTTQDGSPLDLSDFIGAAFYLRGRNSLGYPVLRIAAAAEVDVDAHTLRYQWLTGDTAVSGIFEAEFELVDQAGSPRSVPTQGRITVRVIDDLDDA